MLQTFAGEFWAACEVGGGLGAPWAMVSAKVRAKLRYLEVVDEEGLCLKPGRVNSGLNSGYQALGAVYHWGCVRDVLLGYDMQRGPHQESHHHGDHEGDLPNLGTLPEWSRRMVQLGADLRARGIEVVNCSRVSAIPCFERLPIENALNPLKPPLILHGMSGMGDCLHARSIVCELMRANEVWLKTPWPTIYHDMPGLHLLPVGSTLRTQAKNEKRSRGKYDAAQPPVGTGEIRASYSPAQVKAAGSVLGAMSAVCGVPTGDFRLPVPDAWRAAAAARVSADRPVLVYRPLVARTEWGGATTRNPDPGAYKALFDAIRGRFFVVSVADLVAKAEWMVGEPIAADVEYHRGELEFETLAGLFAIAALIYSAPGFAVVLAQAVGTPAVTVFGGYEDASSYSAGAIFTPWLPIEPIAPCTCWRHDHRCVKTIDLPRAEQRLKEFADAALAAGHQTADGLDPGAGNPVAGFPAALLQPG